MWGAKSSCKPDNHKLYPPNTNQIIKHSPHRPYIVFSTFFPIYGIHCTNHILFPNLQPLQKPPTTQPANLTHIPPSDQPRIYLVRTPPSAQPRPHLRDLTHTQPLPSKGSTSHTYDPMPDVRPMSHILLSLPLHCSNPTLWPTFSLPLKFPMLGRHGAGGQIGITPTSCVVIDPANLVLTAQRRANIAHNATSTLSWQDITQTPPSSQHPAAH